MDTNIIYNIDCVAGMNQMIDEASIDLIIADPPYFKVIGEKWDYLWRTENNFANSSLFRIAINHFESSFLLMLVEPHTAHSVSKLETTAPQALQDPN